MESNNRNGAKSRTGDRGRHSGYGSYGTYGSYGAYRGAGYGYGYGYGSYGYGNSGSAAFQKSLQDYLLVIRERVWYIVTAFLLTFGGVAVYTFTRVPQYTSSATVEVFHRTPTVLQTNQAIDSEISSTEDLNTQVNVLESQAIAEGVAARLTGTTASRFLNPYERSGHPTPTVTQVLLKHRKILPQRLSYIIALQYEHPDRDIAALVANCFADEYIDYNERLRVNQSMEAVSELRQRADEQRKKVDRIAAAIQAYREKNNLVSLDQRKDIVTEALKDLNKEVTDSSAALQVAESNWKQVQECQVGGHSCLDLSFIANISAVAQLQEEVASQKILVAKLSERYRAKHPQMIAAVRSLNEAEEQLQQAINTSVAQVRALYETALRNYRQAQSALAAQEADSLRLDRYGLAYSNLERDYLENEKILDQILASQLQEQQSSSGTLENETARILDRGIPALKASSPNYGMNLGLGAAGAIVIGFGLAFFVAYNDDRVKSAFDIETILGLTLVGVIPRVDRKGERKDPGARTEEFGSAEIHEAFSTIFTSLQLRPESKTAQCLIVTSTIASEGKTFITTGLAGAYADHGERVIVIDCDLRRPAINRVYNIENMKGVIDVCQGNAAWPDVVNVNVRPNLDIISTGGTSRNPTQLLNSKEFAQMISDLRKKYNRIFIDTPPVGVVSDAFVILPLVDGSLYSVYFNRVTRKGAQLCAQRLTDGSVPNYGAILNGLTGRVGEYYYSHYYGRSYKDYATSGTERSKEHRDTPRK